jgi:hypothetical protein
MIFLYVKNRPYLIEGRLLFKSERLKLMVMIYHIPGTGLGASGTLIGVD